MGYLLAFSAAALWGLTYTLDEKVLEEMHSVKLYFLHCVLGLLVSGAAWLLTGGTFGQLFALPSGESTRKILFASMIIGCLAGMAIVSSIAMLGASKSSILEISYPLFVLVFSYVLFDKGVSLHVIAGGLLIFAGSAIIVLSPR